MTTPARTVPEGAPRCLKREGGKGYPKYGNKTELQLFPLLPLYESQGAGSVTANLLTSAAT